MRESVAIVGGGIAGLSAAHELIERGFAVHVYERRDFFGGKAASYRTRAGGAGEIANLPGEHGFRFFPGWYRHLTDTMSRIPYHRHGGGRVSVADNLVAVRSNVLAWFDRPPLPLPLQVPRNVAEAAAVSQFLADFSTLGLNAVEVALFFKKLLALVAMTDDRREETLEGITWWDYLECGVPGRSRAYRDLVRATTRTSVAAKAEEASAYTIGRLVVRTLLDTMSSVDRVLNGPTNEVWIEPWIAYLQSRGVTFHTEMELQSIKFDGASRRVINVVMERVPIANVRRLRRLNDRLDNQGSPRDDDDVAERDRREAVAERHHDDRQQIQRELARSPWVQSVLAPNGQQLIGDFNDARLARLVTAGAPVEVEADYFVLALPLEQLAYYVNRSTMLTFLAPELRLVESLSRHMDWMAGIQFYLSTPLDIASGHIVGLDSTWALTAIEQTQFWDDIYIPDGVRAVLSVDIAAWDKRGRVVRKEAYNCNNREIAEEVWGQLAEMFNKRTYLPVLRPEMLVGGALQENVSYHIDESMVDLRDRKKQAFYERARGMKFNTMDVVNQGAAEDDLNADTIGVATKTWTDQSFMWGAPRRRFNAEPLLVNRAGSRKLRPRARTSIPNLFLAGDFVRTETDLACMEGANEAARDAVNGILEASGSREERCPIWKFAPARAGLQSLGTVRNAVQTVRSAATAATQLQDRFWRRVAGGLARINAGQAGRLDSE